MGRQVKGLLILITTNAASRRATKAIEVLEFVREGNINGKRREFPSTCREVSRLTKETLRAKVYNQGKGGGKAFKGGRVYGGISSIGASSYSTFFGKTSMMGDMTGSTRERKPVYVQERRDLRERTRKTSRP